MLLPHLSTVQHSFYIYCDIPTYTLTQNLNKSHTHNNKKKSVRIRSRLQHTWDFLQTIFARLRRTIIICRHEMRQTRDIYNLLWFSFLRCVLFACARRSCLSYIPLQLTHVYNDYIFLLYATRLIYLYKYVYINVNIGAFYPWPWQISIAYVLN